MKISNLRVGGLRGQDQVDKQNFLEQISLKTEEHIEI